MASAELDANVLLEGFFSQGKCFGAGLYQEMYNGHLQDGKRRNGLLLMG